MTTTAPFTLPKPNEITATWWGQQEEIGLAYLEMVQREHRPTGDEQRAWAKLAQETHRTAEAVRTMFDVQSTDDPEPYPSAREMVADMNATRRLIVSRANSEHPIWTPDENVEFRMVHDGLGHYLSGGAFSWQGELDACGVHFRMVRDEDARRALFTECIGQVAAYYVNGDHAPQVCGFLPEHFTQGKLHA